MAVKSEQELAGPNLDLWKRAQTAAGTNNIDYAISLLRGLLKSEPTFLVGRQKLRAIETQKARGLSAMARQTSGLKTAPIIMKAGGALKKSPEEAMDIIEEALAIDPFSPKANEVLAQAAEALKIPEIVALAYESICEGKPDDIEPLRKLAMVYQEQNQWEKAQQAYSRLLQIAPLDGEAQSGMKNAMAKIASTAGNYDKKDANFRDSLKNKDQAASLEQASKVVKSEEAILAQIADAYAKVQSDPGNINWPKQIGGLYNQLQDYANAEIWYQYAFELGGKADSALEKQVSELKLKKFDKEIQDFRERTDLDPAQQQEQLDALSAQRKQVVLEMAQQRVDKYPTEWEFHYQLGKAYVDLGLYKEALQPLQQGAKSPSMRLDALNLIGFCQWHRKMLDMAEKTFTNAAGEIPVMNDLKKEILYSLGCVLEASGKTEASIEKFKEIYEMDMTYRDVTKRVEDSYGN